MQVLFLDETFKVVEMLWPSIVIGIARAHQMDIVARVPHPPECHKCGFMGLVDPKLIGNHKVSRGQMVSRAHL